jgi:hypothetical protein
MRGSSGAQRVHYSPEKLAGYVCTSALPVCVCSHEADVYGGSVCLWGRLSDRKELVELTVIHTRCGHPWRGRAFFPLGDAPERVAPRSGRLALLLRAAAMTSTRNPGPRDLGQVVLKIDGDNNVTLRPDDEATNANDETEHTRFVVCCAIGVCCSRTSTHALQHLISAYALTHLCIRRRLHI